MRDDGVDLGAQLRLTLDDARDLGIERNDVDLLTGVLRLDIRRHREVVAVLLNGLCVNEGCEVRSGLAAYERLEDRF